MTNNLQRGAFLQGGKYKILQTLGQGGFGVTYEAEQVALHRRVAIKEFFMKEYCDRDSTTSHVTLGSSEGSKELVEQLDCIRQNGTGKTLAAFRPQLFVFRCVAESQPGSDAVFAKNAARRCFGKVWRDVRCRDKRRQRRFFIEVRQLFL